MTVFLKSGAAAVALSAFALPAAAQVSAPDLWIEWQESALEAGAELSVSSQKYDGGALTLTDLVSRFDAPDADVSILVSRAVLTDEDDGSVSIDFPDGLVLEVLSDEDDDGVVRLRMDHVGLDLNVSGASEARTYAYNADEASLTLDEIRERGQAIPMDMSLVITDMKNTMVFGPGDAGVDIVTSTSSIGKLDFSATGEDPGKGSFEISYQLDTLTGESVGPAASFASMEDPGAVFNSPQRSASTVSHGGSGYVIAADNPREPFELAGSSTGGGFSVEIADGGMAYGVESHGIELRVMSSDLPFPVEMAADTFAFGIEAPMVASDDPSDFGLGFTLGGLAVSDGIWNMFDPGVMLPRDPATLILEIAGKAQLFANIYELDENMSAPPGQVTEISIDQLQVTLAGAELTGAGAFAVDNTSFGLVPGAPKVVGAADLMLTGANGLLDTLVAAGLIQDEDAMGARMMMGMVARPGQGEDSLVSKIELTEGGGLMANGMRLQ